MAFKKIRAQRGKECQTCKEVVDFSLTSGGCIKFDIKSWNDSLHPPTQETTALAVEECVNVRYTISAINLSCFGGFRSSADDPPKPWRRWVWFWGTTGLPVGLHTALCGVSNERTKRNFEWVTPWIKKRPEPPLLIASTLLVPGYIDEEEVKRIFRWMASLDPDIPYSLLAFYPQFFFKNLPVTQRDFAFRCKEVAEGEGLRRVRVGNLHLL